MKQGEEGRPSLSNVGAIPSWSPIKVLCNHAVVSDCYADLLVDGGLLVEVKVAK